MTDFHIQYTERLSLRSTTYWKPETCSEFHFCITIWELSCKNTFSNNFVTVRPIFTNITAIDSALQMEDDENFKNVPNFNLGKQWGNFYPSNTTYNNFLTARPIFTNSTPIGLALREKHNGHIRKVPSSFQGSNLGTFIKNYYLD
jgi:hypothetical protein